MARPKKEKKIELPEESLDAVLSPKYTLEVTQEILSNTEAEVAKEVFPLKLEENLKTGLIGFNVVQDSESFSPYVQMILRIEEVGTRKLEAKYKLEDLMDSLAFKVKIDAYVQVKNAQGEFGFDLNIDEIKSLSTKLTRDFGKFYAELEKNGIYLKNELNVQQVSVGIHTHDPITALFEVK